MKLVNRLNILRMPCKTEIFQKTINKKLA